MFQFNYWSLINQNWKLKLSFSCFTLSELNFKLHAISAKDCWIPDPTFQYTIFAAFWQWLGTESFFLSFFSFFANPLLSEIWWQHHNFSSNCRSSKFPHDWKSGSIARNCSAFVIRQREWKLGWQEETFQVFSNLHGGGGPCIMQGKVLRMFGQTQ